MPYILIATGILVCAIQAVLSRRLLISALWLAGTSALVALMMYMLGAHQVAVIELSVGAGLVTVLFIFAINIAGDEQLGGKRIVPKPVAWLFTIIFVLLFVFLCLPQFDVSLPEGITSQFTTMVWENRSVDLLLQIALIFAGILAIIGLLAEGKEETHS